MKNVSVVCRCFLKVLIIRKISDNFKVWLFYRGAKKGNRFILLSWHHFFLPSCLFARENARAAGKLAVCNRVHTFAPSYKPHFIFVQPQNCKKGEQHENERTRKKQRKRKGCGGFISLRRKRKLRFPKRRGSQDYRLRPIRGLLQQQPAICGQQRYEVWWSQGIHFRSWESAHPCLWLHVFPLSSKSGRHPVPL